SDTAIYDSTLLPAHSYTYQTILKRKGFDLAKSEMVNIATMDTTSHEFTWERYTIESPYGSALLWDVAIVSPTDIWAVGMIGRDSIQITNALHWNGNEWELEKIPYIYHGDIWYLPLHSIYVFSSNNIWFEAGINWDGHSFNTIVLNINFPSNVNRMWGTSSNDLYIVGNDGNIGYHTGDYWYKVDSGTDLDFQDIWGAIDRKTGRQQVLAVAFNPYENDTAVVVQIDKNRVSRVQSAGLPRTLNGAWSPDGRQWYVCGDGIYNTRSFSKPWKRDESAPAAYKECIRGNGINDIIVVEHGGQISHWNGYSWRTFTGMSGMYYGLAVKGNLVVAVGQRSSGFIGGPASIVMGRRE
ncbi:MAG: glucosyl transferase, partial [Calditrichota bacterium]